MLAINLNNKKEIKMKNIYSIFSRNNPVISNVIRKNQGEVRGLPIGTISNWNNGPHIKIETGKWAPLKGEALKRYYEENPEEKPFHSKNAKVKHKIREKGEEQGERTIGRQAPETLKMRKVIQREKLYDLLNKGGYSIISAGVNTLREGGMYHFDDYFAFRHFALRDDLEELGVPFIEIYGKYEREETSFIVLHGNLEAPKDVEKSFMVEHGKDKSKTKELLEKLNELAKKYNQDSVIHAPDENTVFISYTTNPEGVSRSNCYGKKGEDGKFWNDQTDQSNYYSEVPHGRDLYTKFNLNVGHCFDSNDPENPNRKFYESL